MQKFTLTVIDTSGIQNYIFGSNSLKHIVGASGLVHYATHHWVFNELIKLGDTNVAENGLNDKGTKKQIEKSDLKSELVYTGGGNTVILFRTHDLAKEFTECLTRKVLLEAPSLQLIICHTEFRWDESKLSDTVSNTIQDVNKKKQNRVFSTPVLGLGVTADCQYTGLPANYNRYESKMDKKEVLISSEVAYKLDFFSSADKRLQDTVPQVKKENLEFVYDFNDFGTKHESSYIAVIHIDGNGMGKRVQAIGKKHETNREYIQAIRNFSISVETAANKALQATVNKLMESRDSEGKIGGIVEIQNQKLPFRPIVFGGDDVTFVTDGRLGITLAEFYLRKLTDYPLSDTEKPMSARAGISVVKSHYPFSRAVALAEDLAGSAKDYIKERQKLPYIKRELSAIDWHFASSGPIGDLESIRQREYTVDSGKLNMRPLYLGKSTGSDWRSWDTFIKIMKEFQGDQWIDKRNKIMDLRSALRKGPEKVEQFVTTYEPHHIPEIPQNPSSARKGWISKCCTCFDAIEALDFFLPFD